MEQPIATSLAHMDLESENRALRQLLTRLAADAEHNETVMQRFHERELSLLTAGNIRQLLEHLTLGMRASFRLDSVRLVLLDPYNVLSELLSGLGINPAELPELRLIQDIQGLSRDYPDLKRPWLGSWNARNHAHLFGRQGLRCVALLPLRQPDGLVGFLHLGSSDPNRFKSEHGTEFLQRLANVAAVCLENAVNRERLRLTGLTDGLTGLYNRRHLEHRLGEEITRACRHHQSLSCLFIDADHFKHINDQYGHAAGDQVLIALAKRIRDQLRGSDLATRYGGEEIAVLLPQTDLANARHLAERIRGHVSATPITLNEEKTINLTVSIGVAQLDPDCEDQAEQLGKQLLENADQQVYRAKEAGRNCVMVNQSL